MSVAGEGPGKRFHLGPLKLRVERVPGLPLVALRSWILAGSRLEPTPGLSLVTGRMLGEGTTGRDWRQWSMDVEGRGMTLQSTGGAETLGVALDSLAEDADLALSWLAELLLDPAFEEGRLHWIRQQAAAELEGMLDQPDYRTLRVFLEQLYHPHPFCRPLQGSREGLDRLSTRDCRDFHRRALGWGGCLVVVGDVDEDRMADRLRAAFEHRLPAPEPFPQVPTIAGHGEPRRQVTVPGKDQAHLLMGHLTVPRAHADRLALDVGSVILGSGPGMAGRLPFRIREREGLSYSVDVALAAGAGLEPGRFQVYLATAPDQVEQAEVAVREELDRVLDGGVTDEEFEDARAYLVGREPFRRETLRQRADRVAETEIYGLPVDRPGWIEARLRELDRSTVEAALRRWIRPQDLHLTVGLPEGSTHPASTRRL